MQTFCRQQCVVDTQVVEALHAKNDDSNIPLKPLEAMLSIDLAHPNIIHTFKFYTRVRQVICRCKLLLIISALCMTPSRLQPLHQTLLLCAIQW